MDEENVQSEQPGQSGKENRPGTTTRRRGDILESAILKAAWDEWNEVGYARFTMESVAARAMTNKTTVYRRWPNKTKLVVAAITKHVPKPTLETPNTGNLRDDVLELLLKIAKPLQIIGAETIHGLMVEYHGDGLIASLPQLMKANKENKLTSAMEEILKNAEKRGEVSLERINARVISLPIDLIRFEILTTHEPLSDEIIIEIIDSIFLPLVIG